MSLVSVIDPTFYTSTLIIITSEMDLMLLRLKIYYCLHKHQLYTETRITISK
jgi:hypothetical protein